MNYSELSDTQRAHILGCLEAADSALTKSWAVNRRRKDCLEIISKDFDNALTAVTSELGMLVHYVRESLDPPLQDGDVRCHCGAAVPQYDATGGGSGDPEFDYPATVECENCGQHWCSGDPVDDPRPYRSRP